MVIFLLLLCLHVLLQYPIIDHIITNDHKNIIFPGIIKSDLTDHYPIFCFIDDVVICSNKTNLKIFRRDFSNFNSSEFCDDLHDA